MEKQVNKGITLIALVITIIVLLILAGVSIATLTGPNGLLTQATEAKKATKDAEMKERVEVEVAGSYGLNGKISKEKLEENLNNLEGAELTDAEEGEDFSWKVILDGYIFNVSDTGKVESAGTIPEKPFENTIKPGEIVTEEKGNTEYRNNGTAIIPVGFAIVPGCEDVSEGLVISDEANDIDDTGNQFVWIPVEGKYERNTAYADGFTLENDTNYLPEGIANESDNVTKAGGFYISRYEAGDGSAKETRTSATDSKLISKKDAYVYNYISQPDAKEKAKEFINNEKVKSGLCTGIQWDMVMDFISKEERLDGENQKYDVTQYLSSRHKGLSIGVQQTGQNPADKVCNIYDLEGNCREYVAEKTSSDDSYIRRGGFYSDQYSIPAFRRNNNNGLADSDHSFRFVLYIM